MRFLLVTTFYPPYHFGGDATYVRALGRELVARGHEVEVVHCQDAFTLTGRTLKPDETAGDGIKIHRLKSRLGVISPLISQQTGHMGIKAGALYDLMASDFDVVNFHNISLMGGPAVLGLSRASVSLYSLHDHWLICPTHVFWKNKQRACDGRTCIRCSLRSGIPPQWWRYTGLVKNSVAHLDALVSPSQYTADLHRDAGLAVNIEVLPLFSRIDPGPVPFGLEPGSYYLYVGRVDASKGIAPLLKQFAAHPSREIRVVGEGELLTSLRTQYASSANIHFDGWLPQEQLVDLYRRARALILPSLSPETFGLTVVEALACGTPAIVRLVGGSHEIIDTTGAGFVYRDEHELERALLELDQNPALRDELRQRARAGFEQHYTADRHMRDYLALIERLRERPSAQSHSP